MRGKGKDWGNEAVNIDEEEYAHMCEEGMEQDRMEVGWEEEARKDMKGIEKAVK